MNIIDDKKIIELYFERNQQAIKKTDIEYGKLCHKIAYNVLNNRQDSEECVNDTYLEYGTESHLQGQAILNLIFPQSSEIFPSINLEN